MKAIYLVGFAGDNASHVVHALEVFKSRQVPERYGLTSLDIFDQNKLPGAHSLIVTGWDVRNIPITHARLEPWHGAPGVRSRRDLKLGDETLDFDTRTVAECIDTLACQITDFEERFEVTDGTVINLSSPAPFMSLLDAALGDVLPLPVEEVPSALVYALAAARKGIPFVDFTPSETLECRSVEEGLARWESQAAGRDGATGQTFLKLVLADALRMRGIPVKSWYSTNLLGNRDGAVLMIPEAQQTKEHDKRHALDLLSGTDPISHKIDIRHMPDWGDMKEAWDSVLLDGFLGHEIELRINWKAADSPLAAQMILDIARIVLADGSSRQPGFRVDLGFFFKMPLGCSDLVPHVLFDNLIKSNEHLLHA